MSPDATLPKKATAAKRTRRGPLTRKQILDASLRLFSERGFARTTVRDIAREAGITDAAIYYHFESKRDLLEALVEERGFLAGLKQLEQVAAELPLEETLSWMARGAVNIMDENRDFLRLIIMEGLGGDESAIEQYRHLTDLWESALGAVLQRYVEKGELPPEAPETLVRQVIYVILMTFQDTLLGRHVPPAASAEERREALISFASETVGHLLRGRARLGGRRP
jgi:AcrR family transcriptional regulator